MSNPRATLIQATPHLNSIHQRAWCLRSYSLACVAIVGAFVGCGKSEPAPSEPQPEKIATESPQPVKHETTIAVAETLAAQPENSVPPTDSPLIDDDGKTLWTSPTHGKPLSLGWLSPGAQIIAVLRPAALLKHPEGEKVVASLGPNGKDGIAFVEQLAGLRLAEMDQLIVGAQATSDGSWSVSLVVHATNATSTDALAAKHAGAAENSHAGKTYLVANERAYYLPTSGKGKVLVVAPQDAIQDVIDLAGQPPPLRRDIERLMDHTDADRHATIIVAPNSLFSEGRSIFAGEFTELRGPLFWFLGDELSGATLSTNWDENFFLELTATPTLETSPERAARIFAKRCSEVPGRLAKYVAGLKAQPYSRELVKRFPSMIRALANYTRSGFEPDHAVLRCYLPAAAGHNLLAAAELTLAESQGGATQLASSDSKSAAPEDTDTTNASADVRERLAKSTSLRFAKDTLEAALEQLSQDIGVPIVIRGPDLQTEGITKNQSFGIDIANKPAEEILVEILRLANPDKTATGAADKRQKLVYVIERKPHKTEEIVVTTRAKAAEMRNKLPAAFQPTKP